MAGRPVKTVVDDIGRLIETGVRSVHIPGVEFDALVHSIRHGSSARGFYISKDDRVWRGSVEIKPIPKPKHERW